MIEHGTLTAVDLAPGIAFKVVARSSFDDSRTAETSNSIYSTDLLT